MNPIRARLLVPAAALVAAAAILVPSQAAASDGTIKATVGKALAQLATHQAVLTRLQGVLAPGTPAAKLKAAGKPALAQGKTLAQAAHKARAALAKQKPSTAKGTAARATCLKLLTGTATLADALVAWGKAASKGKPDLAAAKRLQAGAIGLLQNGVACQTAIAALK